MNNPDKVEGDAAAAFLSKMAEFNFAPETLVTDGSLQRFDVDKKGDKDCVLVWNRPGYVEPDYMDVTITAENQAVTISPTVDPSYIAA